MTTAARFRRSATRLVRRLGDGGTVTVRRRHTLKTQKTGAPTNSLLVNGTHITGASTLALRAAGTLLDGTLPKGCAVTVAGTAYTVQADAEAASNVVTVTILPVLAAGASDGAAATVTTTYVDHTFSALRGRQGLQDLTTGELTSRRVLHLAYRADGIAPRQTDHVVVDGDQRGISSVDVVNPGAGATHYRIAVGVG